MNETSPEPTNTISTDGAGRAIAIGVLEACRQGTYEQALARGLAYLKRRDASEEHLRSAFKQSMAEAWRALVGPAIDVMSKEQLTLGLALACSYWVLGADANQGVG